MYGQFNMKSESFEMIILKSYLNALILKGNLVTRTLKKENEHFYGNEWTRKWWEKHKSFLEYYFVKYVRDESIVFRRSKHIPGPTLKLSQDTQTILQLGLGQKLLNARWSNFCRLTYTLQSLNPKYYHYTTHRSVNVPLSKSLLPHVHL